MVKQITFFAALAFPIVACSVENEPVQTAATPPTTAADPAPAPTRATPPPADEPASVARNDAPRTATPVEGDFVEGKDYRVLTPAQPTSSPAETIEIAEVFMPSCIHCFRFESFINDYVSKAPDGVSFVRIPASFNPMARLHTRAYYAIETMGKDDELLEPMFREYHVNKNRLDSEEKLAEFVAQHGIDRDQFLGTMKSFAVDTKVRKADALARRYGITSVPTIVINGKYVTQASMTGSVERLRDVMDFLIAREAQAN